MATLVQLQSDKQHIDRTRLVNKRLPDPEPGQALFKIHALALTANNITYAAFGDAPALRYWDFFPTEDADWGHMPAWGFASVVQSNVDGLEIGERFYGFWPVASHLIVEPVRVTERGFYDGAQHRLSLTSAYNQYQRTRTDAAYREANEAYQMLLRPLFITSFMLADYLSDNDFFGARQILISSASSKTAFGTAFCLQRQQSDIPMVAVTSTGNRAFVDSLGCYQSSINYQGLETLDPAVPTLYVDFSGDAELRARIHHHFGTALMHDCFAGAARTQTPLGRSETPLPGPSPRAYFAPTQIKKRNSDWGPAEVTRRTNEAELAFVERVSDPNQPWMTVTRHESFEAAQTLITDLVQGRVDPKLGHIVILN